MLSVATSGPCFQDTLVFKARRPFLRFSFPSMATGGPSMAMSITGGEHGWTTSCSPAVHRWEYPRTLMATGGISWSLSTGYALDRKLGKIFFWSRSEKILLRKFLVIRHGKSHKPITQLPTLLTNENFLGSHSILLIKPKETG